MVSAIYAMGDEPWSDTPWMKHALAELGQRELPGAADNPRIQDYYQAVVGAARARRMHDETPWCSAFANWCLWQARIQGSGSLAARSWEKWGAPCVLIPPPRGCIAVLWRESPTSRKGHVAFYLGTQGQNVMLLGGNQGNCVSVRAYPKRRVLGYRLPPRT